MEDFHAQSREVQRRAESALTVICKVAEMSRDQTIRALADDARETIQSAREAGFLTHEMLDEYGGEGIEAVAASVFRMSERDEEPAAQIMRKPRYVGHDVDCIRKEMILSGFRGDACDFDKAARIRVGEAVHGRFVHVARASGRRTIFLDDQDVPAGAVRFYVSAHDAETGAVTLTRVRNAPGRKPQ